MRRLVTAIAAVLAGASMVVAADTTAPTGTALLDAAEAGDHAAAMRLVSAKGANVNATGNDGSTAIMYAAANGDLELVRALIKSGANVKPANQLGTSAITEAAIIGSAPILDALLKAGANPNFKTTNAETPLMAAARSGKVDAAKVLLDAGADINAKESWGEQSALMWAAAQSRHGEVPGVLQGSERGRESGRSRQDQSVGTQGHPGASPERYE
jgi:ankyrin repeat protein